jgi:hypothetical protein
MKEALRWAWPRCAGWVAGVTILLAASSAQADDKPDTVVLKSGGRLRGTVMEEDPQRGVSIKLLDGTTRKVLPKEVDHVDYAAAASPPSIAPRPPPTPAAPLPMALPPPMYMPVNVEGNHSSSKSLTAVWVTGLVGFLVVYTAGIPITAAVAYGTHGDHPAASVGEACVPLAGAWIGLADSQPGETSGQKAAIVAAGIAQLTFATLFVVGLSVRHDSRETASGAHLFVSPLLAPGATGGAVGGVF